jgi:hypothetical protein
VGVGVGTLVLLAPAQLQGAEIEISPAGEDSLRRHVAVLARTLPDTTVHAAVYAGLAAGRYRLWRTPADVALEVDVPEGVVTEVSWPLEDVSGTTAAAGEDP